jgi:hypothetical protein
MVTGVICFCCLVLVAGGQTPTPVTPTPINPTPINPTPIVPKPVTPTPIQATPINPTPINPTPINPTPIGPTPINPTPITPIQTPQIQTPNIQTPNIQTPTIQGPNIQTPNMQAPNIQTPNIQAPNIQTPNITTPDMQAPNMQTPSTMKVPNLEPLPEDITTEARQQLQQQAQQLQAQLDQFNNDAQAYNNLPPDQRTAEALKALVTRQSQLVNAIGAFNRTVHNFAQAALQAKPVPQTTPRVPTQVKTAPQPTGMSGGDAALIGLGVAGAGVAVAGLAAMAVANQRQCADGYSLCLDGACCPTHNIGGVLGSYHFPAGCIGSASGAANYSAHTGIVPSPCADEGQRRDISHVRGLLQQLATPSQKR